MSTLTTDYSKSVSSEVITKNGNTTTVVRKKTRPKIDIKELILQEREQASSKLDGNNTVNNSNNVIENINVHLTDEQKEAQIMESLTTRRKRKTVVEVVNGNTVVVKNEKTSLLDLDKSSSNIPSTNIDVQNEISIENSDVVNDYISTSIVKSEEMQPLENKKRKKSKVVHPSSVSDSKISKTPKKKKKEKEKFVFVPPEIPLPPKVPNRFVSLASLLETAQNPRGLQPYNFRFKIDKKGLITLNGFVLNSESRLVSIFGWKYVWIPELLGEPDEIKKPKQETYNGVPAFPMKLYSSKRVKELIESEYYKDFLEKHLDEDSLAKHLIAIKRHNRQWAEYQQEIAQKKPTQNVNQLVEIDENNNMVEQHLDSSTPYQDNNQLEQYIENIEPNSDTHLELVRQDDNQFDLNSNHNESHIVENMSVVINGDMEVDKPKKRGRKKKVVDLNNKQETALEENNNNGLEAKSQTKPKRIKSSNKASISDSESNTNESSDTVSCGMNESKSESITDVDSSTPLQSIELIKTHLTDEKSEHLESNVVNIDKDANDNVIVKDSKHIKKNSEKTNWQHIVNHLKITVIKVNDKQHNNPNVIPLKHTILNDAICDYNRRHSYNYLAINSATKEQLNRAMVLYIKNNLVQYDKDLIDDMYNDVNGKRLGDLLHNRILNEIAKQYPELANICRKESRQI